MRIAKLLVLGAVLLFGSNAAKAVDDNVWQKPALTEFASLVDGEIYYFYNTGSQLLFTQGNAWGTQASVGTRGLKVKVELNADGFYTLTDFCKSKNAWLMWWFVDDGVSMYVDYNGQADYRWKIRDLGGNVYRLSPSQFNPTVNNEDMYVGLNRTVDATTTALTANNTVDGGAFIDWQLIPEAAGDAYDVAEELYEAAMKLYEILKKGEEIGAEISGPLAVYNNTNSTLEELNKAIEEAQAAVEAREEEIARGNLDNATVDNPIDVTKLFITNPSYDDNKNTGWSGNTPGFQSYTDAEFYQAVFNVYQDLKELPEGVYGLNLQAFHRPGWGDSSGYTAYIENDPFIHDVNLYAENDITNMSKSIVTAYEGAGESLGGNETAVTTVDGNTIYIPNNMETAENYFNAGRYHNTLTFATTNGEVRIGLKNSASVSGNWVIYDNWGLNYYGKGDDAYNLLKSSVQENLKDFGDLSDVIYTQAYYDNYQAAVAATNAASGKDAILAALAEIQKASDEFDRNITLWKTLVAVADSAKLYISREEYSQSYRNELSDWAEFEVEDYLKARDLTNEELADAIAFGRNLIQEVIKHPGVGADVTDMLVNPSFSNDATGWTVVKADGGNVAPGGSPTNRCFEAWNNANFDIYQVVSNAPKGVYEIKVQGFYRYGRGNAYQAYLNHEYYTTPESVPVFVYMNANTTPLTNIFGDPVQITDETFYSANSTDYSSETLDDGTILYFPNGMSSAAIAFENGMYTQSAYGLVAQDGDEIRLGVKGSSNQLGDSWCIWDNFKLYYQGFMPDIVRPVLEQAIADAESNLNSAIGKDVAEALQAAIDEAKAVVNGNDGDAMFNALTKLFDMKDAVTASKALFATLEAANERLANAIPSAVASADIVNEAKALNMAIASGLENHTYADTEVEGLINEINKMINRLGIPQDMLTASDASPVECTTIIVNPAYVDGNDNGWTGGAAVNASANDAEKFNTTFNYYQLLQGLPAGTYKVSVQGFFRFGGSTHDYDEWIADPTANNNSFLYAAVGSDTVSVAMHRLASQAQVMDGLSDGWVWASESNQLAVPNSMATAADAFQTPSADGTPLYANNNVIVKVGEDGNLVIGLKKNINTTDDWTIWTNWQLFYYGNNSSLQESDNPLSIANVEGTTVVNAEFFTVNGTRVSGLQRGITIVRETLSDGSVRVSKVSVK